MDEHAAKKFIDRIVNLEEEIAALRGDVKEIYNEAKEAGHLKGALRLVVARVMETADQRESREAIEAEARQIIATMPGLSDLFEYAGKVSEVADEIEKTRGRGRSRKHDDQAEDAATLN
jgi:uncharacterized protein (UPF0335 family)